MVLIMKQYHHHSTKFHCMIEILQDIIRNAAHQYAPYTCAGVGFCEVMWIENPESSNRCPQGNFAVVDYSRNLPS